MAETIKNENQENQDITENKTANPAKKKIAKFLSVIVIIGIAYFAYFYFYGSHYQSTENAYVTGNQTSVTSQIGGSITAINFADTSVVKKGDLLVQFEDTDYQLAVEGAKLELAQAVRNYSSLNTNVTKYDHSLQEAQNNYNNVRKNYNRSRSLYKAGLISRQTMDASTTQYNNAKLAVSLGHKALNNAKLQASSKNVYSHPAVQGAILKYKQAMLNLSRTKIYSPVDGTIGKKSISIGQKIGNGYPLFSVMDLSNEWVEVNLKENQLKKLKIGNPVELESSLNGKKYEGYVIGISAGTGNAFSLLPPQNASGNWIKITQRVPVRVAFNKKDLLEKGPLPLGTTMEATINTEVVKEDLPTIATLSSNPYTLDMDKIQKTIDDVIKSNSY